MSKMRDEDPAERFVSDWIRSSAGQARLEAHLDAHPLPVDEAVVQAHARRLAKRLGKAPPQRRWRTLAGLGALAAALMLGVRVWPAGPVSVPSRVEQSVASLDLAVAEMPPPAAVEVSLLDVGASLIAEPGGRLLVSEVDDVAVVFSNDQAVWVNGQRIEPGTWVVLSEEVDGTRQHLTFPDGTAPPRSADVMTEDVDDTLQQMRWQSLPPRTQDRLDELLDLHHAKEDLR
ncbi:MAG: hypothetical protein AAGA48_03345 [Myxococcota bacterium]